MKRSGSDVSQISELVDLADLAGIKGPGDTMRLVRLNFFFRYTYVSNMTQSNSNYLALVSTGYSWNLF